MSEYKYTITIQIENGEPEDCWCEHDGKLIGYPLGALNPFINHARQDWQERQQDKAEDAADAKREARGERG